MNPETIGYIASAFYIASLSPELYTVYKTKECNLTFYFIMFQIVTACLFIVYDVMIGVIPLLIADVVFLLELLFLILFKLFYQKKIKNRSISNRQSTIV
jgi:uncharacterized protein with PQ loop repeat